MIELEKSKNLSIFLREPSKGLKIKVFHSDPDENKPESSLIIHVSFEGYSI